MASNRRLDVESLAQDSIRSEYDAGIATLGYEDRSSYLWRTYKPRLISSVAFGFPDSHILSFPRNLKFYKGAGYNVSYPEDNEFADSVRACLRDVSRDEPLLRVIVDVSSLTRNRIALLCECFTDELPGKTLDVDFVYFIARFQAPTKRERQNAYAGPVTPRFAGWWRYPEFPVAAVIGLGYEENKALGAVEHLQVPESIWTFLPASNEPQYDLELVKANRDLFRRVPSEQRITYNVEDPFETYTMLKQLVSALSETQNVVLLPFGPKLFALLSILVGIQGHGAAVWRISAGRHERPRDAFAKSAPIGLRVRFNRAE